MSNEEGKKDVLLWKFKQIKVLSYSHVWFFQGGRCRKFDLYKNYQETFDSQWFSVHKLNVFFFLQDYVWIIAAVTYWSNDIPCVKNFVNWKNTILNGLERVFCEKTLHHLGLSIF